jgi:hypothetical protein
MIVLIQAFDFHSLDWLLLKAEMRHSLSIIKPLLLFYELPAKIDPQIELIACIHSQLVEILHCAWILQCFHMHPRRYQNFYRPSGIKQ